MNKKPNSDGGQALVEFALVAVLLFMLIFGIFEFSFILYDKAMLTYAAREGTRAAITFDTAPDPNDPTTWIYTPSLEGRIKSRINDYAKNRLVTFGTPFDATNPGAVDIKWYDKDGNLVAPADSRKGHINVLVNFEYKYLVLPNFAAFGNGRLPLNVRTIMRME